MGPHPACRAEGGADRGHRGQSDGRNRLSGREVARLDLQRGVFPGSRGLDLQFGGDCQDAQRHRRSEIDPGAVGRGNTGGRGLCRRGASQRTDGHSNHRRIQPCGRGGNCRKVNPLRSGGAGNRPPFCSPNYDDPGPLQIGGNAVARQSGTLLRPCAGGRRTGPLCGRRCFSYRHSSRRHDTCPQDHPDNVARARSARSDLLRIDRDACQLRRAGQVPDPRGRCHFGRSFRQVDRHYRRRISYGSWGADVGIGRDRDHTVGRVFAGYGQGWRRARGGRANSLPCRDADHRRHLVHIPLSLSFGACDNQVP